jgi:glutaredoxin
MLPALAALAFLASAPLDEAKGHLKAGRIDDVFFALDGKTLPDGEKAEAARVLADAGKRALGNKDAVMALQLAKMAIKLSPEQVSGLEVASRASRALEQFSDAEAQADAWLKAEPASTEAAIWRAELSCDAGDWSEALALLDTVKTKSTATARAKELRARAEKELASRQTGLSGLRQLERDLARAQAEYRGSAQAQLASAPARSNDIVLYGTAWCGYCKKARAYLKKKGVSFADKDVEKDPGAAQELGEKAARAGKNISGVPVIDVKGTLIQGFDQVQLEKLLQS